MADESEKYSVGLVYDDTLDSNDGVAQVVKRLGSWLTSQGHDVSYLVGQTKISDWQGGNVYSLSRNIKVRFNGNTLSIPLWASAKNIKAVLNEKHFDILHVQMPHSPFMAGRVIKMAVKDTTVVGTFHILPSGWLSSWGSRVLKAMYGKSLGRITAVSATSKPAAAFAKQAYGISASVIPNAVELSKFQTSRSQAMVDGHIVFLGRLVKRKGCEQLLKAFLEVSKTLPEARLTIAGDGPQRRKLEHFVNKHKLTDSVKFLGFIDEAAKPALLASASVACFPSLYGESFGIVLIEAMAAGSGVVLGGNNPGYSSVLAEQPLLLVDPTNTEEFAARLTELLTSKAHVEALHNWQLEEVRKYDINVVGKQVEQMYSSAIAQISQSGHNSGNES